MAIRSERTTEVVFLRTPVPPLSDAARAAAERLFWAADGWLRQHGSTLFGSPTAHREAETAKAHRG